MTKMTITTPSRVRSLFSFPNPVNEVSARLVAGGVVIMSVLIIALNVRWATVVIAYGFVARVLTGPSLSPLGQVVTRVITPRLGIAERPGGRTAQAFCTGHRGGVLPLCRRPDGSGLLGRRPSCLGALGRGCLLGVGPGPVPRVQGLRSPHAGRHGAPGGVRALQQHLGEGPGGGLMAAGCPDSGGRSSAAQSTSGPYNRVPPSGGCGEP